MLSPDAVSTVAVDVSSLGEPVLVEPERKALHRPDCR